MKMMQFGVLRNEFEGHDGGGGGTDVLDDQNSIVMEPGEEHSTEGGEGGEGGGGREPVQPDWNQIGEAMARTMASAMPRPQAAPQPQMSKEEFRKLTQYYQVTPEQVTAIFSQEATPEQRVAALQNMIDGAATHAIATSKLLVDQQRQQFEGQLTPVQQMIQKSYEDRFLGDVTSEYPQLKGMDGASRLAINLMRQQGYRHTSDAQTKRDFLATLQQVVSMAGGRLSLQRSQQTNTGRAMPKMAGTVNGGGQSGGGAGGARKPAWLSALED